MPWPPRSPASQGSPHAGGRSTVRTPEPEVRLARSRGPPALHRDVVRSGVVALGGSAGDQRRRAEREGGGDRQQDRVTDQVRGQREEVGGGEAEVGERVVGRRQAGQRTLI